MDFIDGSMTRDEKFPDLCGSERVIAWLTII